MSELMGGNLAEKPGENRPGVSQINSFGTAQSWIRSILLKFSFKPSTNLRQQINEE
jgi:hypothetical protein